LFTPAEDPVAAAHRSVDEISEKLWELCNDSSLTSGSFLAMRRRDKELSGLLILD
jgi:hypothetical protein